MGKSCPVWVWGKHIPFCCQKEHSQKKSWQTGRVSGKIHNMKTTVPCGKTEVETWRIWNYNCTCDERAVDNVKYWYEIICGERRKETDKWDRVTYAVTRDSPSVLCQLYCDRKGRFGLCVCVCVLICQPPLFTVSQPWGARVRMTTAVYVWCVVKPLTFQLH